MQTLQDKLKYFLISSYDLENRLDPAYYSPNAKRVDKLEKLLTTNHTCVKLEEIIQDKVSGEWGLSAQNKQGSLRLMKVLRNTNFINDGNLEYSNHAKRFVKEPKYTALVLQKNDLLIEKSGGSPDQPVGRVAIFEKNSEDGFGFSNFILRLRIKDSRFNPMFIFIYLKTIFERGYTESIQSHTTGIRNLRINDFLNIPIPIISIDEQERIINAVNRSGLYQKKDFNAALLSDVNSILSENLDIVAPSRADRKLWFIAEKTELTDRLDADPYHPDRINAINTIRNSKYPIKRLDEIVVFEKSQVRSLSGEKYIGLENIEPETGKKINTSSKTTVSSANIFRKNDILFAKLRPYLNKVYLAEFDGVCSTEFHVLRCMEGILPEYLRAFLGSEIVVRQTSHLMTGNTLPRLQTEDIKSLLIPVPSLAVQKEIASKIKEVQDKNIYETQKLLKQKTEVMEEIESLIFG